MRFNRVLLLAASLNLAVLAMIFTISCSGDKGSRGNDGISCAIQATEDSYVFLCDGAEVGEVPKGGSSGGIDGQGCTANKVGNTVQIVCGGQVQGTLNDCSVTEGEHAFEAFISCGASNFGLCYGEVFDPSVEKCKETGGPGGTGSITRVECGEYYGDELSANEYCGYMGYSDWAYDSVLVAEGFPRERTKAIPFCGGNADQRPNEESYNLKTPEYCRWYNEDPKSAKVSDEYCDDGSPINSSSLFFREEYCGYATQTASTRTIIGPSSVYRLCDEAAVSKEDGKWYRGPNELAFGAGYCQAYRLVDEDGVPLLNAKNGKRHVVGTTLGNTVAETKTRYSEDFCGNIPSNGVPSESNKLNEKTWKGQFCGYANSADATAEKKTRLASVCDNGIPNAVEWNDEYCESYRLYVAGFGVTAGFPASNRSADTLTLTKVSDEYCGTQSRTNTANRLNAGAISGSAPVAASIFVAGTAGNNWKREYCGFNSTNASSSSQIKIGTLSGGSNGIGVCLDGTKPNASGYTSSQPEYCRMMDKENKLSTAMDTKCDAANSKINVDSWANQYCGFGSGSATTTSVMIGICDDGIGPNATSNNNGEREYCAVLPESVTGDFDQPSSSYKTSVSNKRCQTGTGTVNESTWKKEYCGYTTLSATQTSVQFDICQDGTEPKGSQSESAYCRVMAEGAKATKSTEFCGTGTVAANRLNEFTWKREFCFDGDDKRSTCNAGYKPISGNKSTDAHDIRCEVIGGNGASSDPNAGEFTPVTVAFCTGNANPRDPITCRQPNCTSGSTWFGTISTNDWGCATNCSETANVSLGACPMAACSNAIQNWAGDDSDGNYNCYNECTGNSNNENPWNNGTKCSKPKSCPTGETWYGTPSNADWGCTGECTGTANVQNAGAGLVCAINCPAGTDWVGTTSQPDWGCRDYCTGFYNAKVPTTCAANCEDGYGWLDPAGGTTAITAVYGCRLLTCQAAANWVAATDASKTDVCDNGAECTGNETTNVGFWNTTTAGQHFCQDWGTACTAGSQYRNIAAATIAASCVACADNTMSDAGEKIAGAGEDCSNECQDGDAMCGAASSANDCRVSSGSTGKEWDTSTKSCEPCGNSAASCGGCPAGGGTNGSGNCI